MSDYETLMKEMPKIGKAISGLPKETQEKAFDLLTSLLLEKDIENLNVPPGKTITPPKKPTGKPDLYFFNA